METETLLIIIAISLILNIVVFYLLIKSAVRAATKDILRSLRILINLKAQELSKEDIATAIQKVNDWEIHVKRQKDGYISFNELKDMQKDYLV